MPAVRRPLLFFKDKEIGIGIPLVKELALRTGGDFAVESTLGNGAVVSALFKPYDINMLPIGDLYKATLELIKQHSDIDFVLYQKQATET